MKLIKNTLSIIFIFTLFSLNAQPNCDYMFDAIPVNDGFIITNEIKGDSGSADIPVVLKVNDNGQEIWRIEDSIDTGYTNLKFMKLYAFSNNEVFIILTILDTHHNSPSNIEIWKIDTQNGTILWKSDLFVSDRDAEAKLLDYNTNTLIFYNPLRHSNGELINGFEVFKIEKSNGTFSPVYTLNQEQKNIQIVKDSKGNLIYTYYHPITHKLAFRKINLTDFKSVIWQRDFTNNVNAKIDIVEKIIINAKDELFIFGHNALFDTDLIAVNSNTGDTIWEINNLCYDNFISDYKFINENLYISFRHQFVGSVTSSFFMQKIDLNTHSILWNKYLNMDFLGNSTSANGENQAILAFDIHCNDTIFATGYYGSNNYEPGAFGIMKIDAENGDKINDLTVTLDAANMDFLSNGLKVFIKNDFPYFFGNLQYNNSQSTRIIAITDTNLNAVNNLYSSCDVLDIPIYDESSFKIYPIPVKDLLFIDNNNQKILKIELIDLNGKVLITKTNLFNTLNCTSLKKGIYYIRIKTNQKIEIQKIIKL